MRRPSNQLSRHKTAKVAKLLLRDNVGFTGFNRAAIADFSWVLPI